MRTLSRPATLLAACLAACGADTRLRQAESYERQGAFAQAAFAFREFAAARPDHPRAAEAHYRAGAALGFGLERCGEAAAEWEAAARLGSEPWSGRAQAALLECPDYFPLAPGTEWEYVDSQTGGANMREVVTATAAPKGLGGALVRRIYAGSRLFVTRRLSYAKADWAVREVADPARPQAGVPVLRFPFRKGMRWTSGGRVTFVVEADDARPKTRAGTFERCLKVKAQAAGLAGSWKFDYYCPGVGRVLTTIAGPGFENPNSELKSFKRPGRDKVESRE